MERYKKYKIAIWILSLIIIMEGVFIFILASPKKRPARIPVAIKGKIAIVLDDWGYNLNNLHILDQIKYPLTLSILPSLSYSRVISNQLYRRGFEIILHLPMEPHEKCKLEQNTIMISMGLLEITNILRKDLTSVQNVSGVSNHMGSRATEDPATMGFIFKELKKRGLYFLDSVVSSESICFDLAQKMHLGFAKRDVFLDNQEESGYIKGQIDKLKTIAGVYGQAIGIGHDRKITLEVLKEVMPELKKEGYKFVFVSELVH